MRSLTFLFSFIFLFLSQFYFSQTAKVLTGECLEDDFSRGNIEFIDADSTGAYFFKKGTKDGNLIYYIDKFDATSLKRVYRCVIPQMYHGNKLEIKQFFPFYRTRLGDQSIRILKNGIIDLVFINSEKNVINFYHVRVNKDGTTGSEMEKSYSREYIKKIGDKDADIELSANKKYFSIYNFGETKKATEITTLLMDNTETSFKISKFYDYTLEQTKEMDETALCRIYGDGRLGGLYGSETDAQISILNTDKKLNSRKFAEITNNNNFTYGFYSSNTTTQNNIPMEDDQAHFVIFDKKTEKYGFLSCKYDKAKNELVYEAMNYINNENAARLKGVMKSQHVVSGGKFYLRQVIKAKDFDYRVFSRNYTECTNICFDVQDYLFVLKYSKDGKLLDQNIIPFELKGLEIYETSALYGEKLSGDKDKNFGTVFYKGQLYFFTNENKNNNNFDVGKGLMKEFEVCKTITESLFRCYTINAGGKTERVNVSYDDGILVYNIANNFSLTKNYQYVYIYKDKKKWLGKVVIE